MRRARRLLPDHRRRRRWTLPRRGLGLGRRARALLRAGWIRRRPDPGRPPAARDGAKRRDARRRRKRLLLALAAAGVGALIVLALLPEPVPVDAARVVRGPLAVTVDEDGMTRVRDRYTISSPITGEVARIRLQPGDRVRPGELLTTISPTPLSPREREEAVARLRAAEASAEEALAAVAQAEAALEQAIRDRDRAERLAAAGALARREAETTRLEAETRTTELEAARARAEAAAFEVEAARAALIGADPGVDGPGAALPIRSPIHGQVLRVLEEDRRVVSAGAEIIELGDLATLEVVIDVLSTDAVDIDPGDPIYLYDWGGERTIEAVVERVEPSGFQETSALGIEELRVNVIGRLLEPPGPLGDQYRVEARIVTWQADDVLKIPTSALFRHEERWAVFTIEGGRARIREITIGHRGTREVEVLSGLREGETVILYPGNELEEGQRVEPRE